MRPLACRSALPSYEGTMMPRLICMLAAVGTSLAVSALSAPSAKGLPTDPTWSVSAGSAANGAMISFTGASTGDTPQITWNDVTSDTVFICDSGKVTGNMNVGTGLAADGIASLDGTSTALSCFGPFSLEFNFSGSGTWRFDAGSYSGGVTTGTISDITMTEANPDSQCSFDLNGTIDAQYNNATQGLTLSGATAGLAQSKTDGCFGLWNDGDQWSIQAIFHLVADDAADNPIAITSP